MIPSLEAAQLLLKRPWLAAVLSGVGLLACGFTGWGHWLDYRAFEVSPVRTGLVAAASAGSAGRLVIVTDAKLSCAGERMFADGAEQRGYVPMTDPSGAWHGLLVRDGSGPSCARLASAPVAGLLHAIDSDRLLALRNQGLEVALPAAGSDLLELCTDCHAEDSRSHLVLLTGLAVGFLFFTPFWFAFARSKRGRELAAKP